jgi:hypothetical protein
MAHTLNWTSVSSAVALLLNLQQQDTATDTSPAYQILRLSASACTRCTQCHTTTPITSGIGYTHCLLNHEANAALLQSVLHATKAANRGIHVSLAHLSASTMAPRLPGSPALCSKSRSLNALPSTRVRLDSCSSCKHTRSNSLVYTVCRWKTQQQQKPDDRWLVNLYTSAHGARMACCCCPGLWVLSLSC